MHTGETDTAGDGATEIPSQLGELKLAIAGGLAPGSNLRSNRIVELTPTGLVFASTTMTWEQWRELLAAWQRSHANYHLCLADIIGFGREQFGDERVMTVLEQLEFNLQDTHRALGILSLDFGVRDPLLTSEHYWVLSNAKLTIDDQLKWKAATIEHKLTATLLAESITAGKVIVPAAGSSNRRAAGGLATPAGIAQAFDLWFHTVEDSAEPISTWDEQRKRETWEYLKGPTRVGLQLARALGVEIEAGV